MKDRKQSHEVKTERVRQHLGWWEVKMILLLFFIVAMLVTGKVLQGRRLQAVVQTTSKGMFWQWQLPLSERLGVTFTEPWLMSATDLNRDRAVYNWLTKPGFRWLVAEGVLGIGMVWLLSWTLATAWVWQKRKLASWQAAFNKLARSRVEVRIGGTVTISAGQGLIYVSSDGSGVEVPSQEYYGIVLARVEIRLVEA